MIKDKNKIIILSFAAGIALWIIDALIDSYLFSHAALSDSLIFRVSAHELYFRSFFLISFILFGLIVSRLVARSEKVHASLEEATLKAALEEARSKAVIASIGHAISVQDTNFVVLFQNDLHKELVGDHVGEFCYRGYRGNESICEPCHLAMSFKDGDIHSLIQTKETDEGTRYYEIMASPLKDTEGKVIAGIESVREVTEQKKAEQELLNHRECLSRLIEEKTSELKSVVELLQDEIADRRKTEEALRESERRYRELVNYMSSGVAVFEAAEGGENFIFKDFNQAGERIEGLKKEDVIGKKITDVFPSIRESGLLEVLQRVWEKGAPESRPASLYKDDRISGWRENYVYKLPSGEIVSVYNDVTEHQLLAERESKLLRELKTIFENFPIGIVYLDNNFRIISTNKFFNNFMGFEEGELIGKTCYDVIGEYSENPSKRGVERICSFCKKFDCLTYMRPSVIERPYKDKFLRVSTIPEIDDEGNISHFMEIIEDITERKLAEAEAVRASHLAALGELAAGVAHEINNPINGIINYTQILLNKAEAGSREHEISVRIIKESDRIAGIVHNLLSFARDSKHDKIPVNIGDILSESIALTEAQIQKDGITLLMDIPAHLPPVLAQPQQIEQVFLNIISNARYALNMKYQSTDENKVLDISVEKIDAQDNKSYIRIIFNDTGTGIPAGIMDKIMNPFFSTKAGAQGTGLGLSISHGIVNDHGGKIQVDSIEGKFTKVMIDLPVNAEKYR